MLLISISTLLIAYILWISFCIGYVKKVVFKTSSTLRYSNYRLSFRRQGKKKRVGLLETFKDKSKELLHMLVTVKNTGRHRQLFQNKRNWWKWGYHISSYKYMKILTSSNSKTEWGKLHKFCFTYMWMEFSDFPLWIVKKIIGSNCKVQLGYYCEVIV